MFIKHIHNKTTKPAADTPLVDPTYLPTIVVVEAAGAPTPMVAAPARPALYPLLERQGCLIYFYIHTYTYIKYASSK